MLETHLVSSYRISPPSSTHVFIADYNEVCQLYKAAHHKLAVARLSNEHRASMAPPASQGRGFQHGECAARGARRRPVIVEETEESGNYVLEDDFIYILRRCHSLLSLFLLFCI
ncbi:hypothetical protein JCGZ_24248 [Jatropha curcas]|uniref:Uncharacterized protein n=1 Tax=Jatropha curcas TaxID=180498 RepID=A0A067JQN9_JATCU|nr:hypothetical protein JCGZ_24248 [Jatropha curcas]